ncbi:glycerophosphodiester phosphodiesterase family protein [Celeribacter arenosi]|uniref:Glycerophosphodiester phosphodiesterase family protein n=1 Tax=Celeribacter arenosi TaxID=792649 RepID=A0ABP7K026_9RHOB
MPPLPDAFLARPITHRALHDGNVTRAENNLAAIDAAIDAGFGIEIDIQPARDNTPMVFHDYDLARLTDLRGPIAMQTTDTLSRATFTTGETGVPTLADVLKRIAGRVPLLIEIKDQDGNMGPDIGPLEAAMAPLLNAYKGPVAVMSFNPHSVIEMARLSPQIPRGLTTSAFAPDNWPLLSDQTRRHLRTIPDYDTAGASFISHHWSDLGTPRVRALKDSGAKILCWTVRSGDDERAARTVADNITFESYLPA